MITTPTILGILFIICFSILVTNLIEPFETFKFNYKLRPEFHEDNKVLWGLTKLLTCSKCLSFWSTLIIYFDIQLAVVICVVVELITRNLLPIRI